MTQPIKKPLQLRQTQKMGQGGAGAAPSGLFGRDSDLALIDRLFDHVFEEGAAFVISGDPGIGKTALLEVAKERARSRGMRVLSSSGVSTEAQLPFAGLQQALRPIMSRIKVLAPRQRMALLAAFGMGDEAVAPDIFLVALATLTLLSESAARKPVLLAVDDVHWLDQPTYDVLSFISRRLSSDPIVLLVAAREGSDRMFGQAGASRHRLAGLDGDAADQLLNAKVPNLPIGLRRRFMKEAAGNPLALLELPRSKRARDIDQSIWLPLTERLERAFYSRVSELPDDTRALLVVAAENDATSLHEILRAGSALLGAHLGLDALIPAISSKLVEIMGTELRFRHPLVQSAIHQSIDPVTRQAAHAALAAVIHNQPDRQVWHRAVSTSGQNEELAIELDTVATHAQRRGGITMAIMVLENAARLSATATARSDRLLRAAELAAELAEQSLVERLIRKADQGISDPLTLLRIGWIREMSQQPMVNDPLKISTLVGFAAQAHLVGAIELAVNLLWRAAQRCWWGNAPSATRAEILTAAEKLGMPDLDPRLIAITGYAAALERGGDVHRWLTAFTARIDMDPTETRILGSTANVIGAYDLGVAFLTEASTSLREQGRLGDLARVLFALAWAEMETGNWIGAMQSAEEASQFGEETGGTLWIAAATIVKAKLAGMRGDIDLFETLIADAERLILPVGASFLLALLQVARGVTLIGAGRYGEAYGYLERLFDPADPAHNLSIQFFGLADFVEAALFCGQMDAAQALLDDMGRASAPTPVPWVQAMLDYGQALLAPPEDAERRFQDGLATVKAWPFMRGRLLLAYGGFLRRQRRPSDARVPLRAARDVFDALGATPWGDRARQELRASGESSRRRTESVWDSLSPQELHIAKLAAAGLSNKEIGVRLYLSHRTVAYHLSRIFPKIGVASRSGLRAILSLMPASVE